MSQWNEVPADPTEAVALLMRLHEQRSTTETAIAVAVEMARSHGISWTGIGAALGISKQGAQQRYGA